MMPAQAIVSATKNGAVASKALKDFGTLEAGKIADLLVLDAGPLADISNIRKMNRGHERRSGHRYEQASGQSRCFCDRLR